MIFAFMLLMSCAFFKISKAQPTTIYVYPPFSLVQVCTEFTIEVRIENVADLHDWGLYMSFAPTLMQCVSVMEGPFLLSVGPTMFGYQIDNVAGTIMTYCSLMIGGGAFGGGILVSITFHCTGEGSGLLHLYDTFLINSFGELIHHNTVDGSVTQTTMYWKPPYADYAPSGVPDFDQKQDHWINPQTSQWSYCGPTAVANSLWWLDSKFEPIQLVTNYSNWDDHDPRNVPPFIEDLAWYMDTDGQRTGINHNGTRVTDMAMGILNYLKDNGLDNQFNVKMIKMPTFEYVEKEVERCEDTILLLGFWQEQPPGSGIWVRVGGHYVTVPGIDSPNLLIAFSDPYLDNAEPWPHGGNGPGVVIPPPQHPHPQGPPDPVHNNATYVSHDIYAKRPPSTNPSPGNPEFEIQYTTEYDLLFKVVNNTVGQNCPDEFKRDQGVYNPQLPISTEVEYGVFVSPMPPMYWKPEFEDYSPSGMPDFDERQWLTYNWSTMNTWSHCAPVAVANSLWWFDSKYENNTIPPPTVIDNFKLVSSYATMPPFWDDHDPRNVPFLIEHLAYLMDTDGRRTGIPHVGTTVQDMQTGIAQYLSWTGVNPRGDVNGDGIVNQTDVDIVTAAFNSVPGAPNWNMAADIAPVTNGWPNRLPANNAVDVNDAILVSANLGKKGMFYERTIPQPSFDLIEKEVEKCEDVVLTLGFWMFNGVTWVREDYQSPYPNTGINGHAVTVAGVNSTTFKIAISDPAFDAFEDGLTPEGRIPAAHIHTLPEPPYVTHNNASLVSQDIYNVQSISPPLPPCPGGNWTIVGYGGLPAGLFAVIENAVITSPLLVHDVAVINVTSWKTVVCQQCLDWINVTVANMGNFTETFNVTLYAGTMPPPSPIKSLTVSNLLSSEKRIVTFTWNAGGWAKGNYTLSAVADTVSGETNTTNNSFTDSWVIVSMKGDICSEKTGPFKGWPDGRCDMSDVYPVCKLFGVIYPNPKYVANCDVELNLRIDMGDIYIVAKQFGKIDP